MINIVKEINELLIYAIERNISDIHCEGTNSSFCIRIRKDGVLKIIKEYSREIQEPYLARLKVMANLDINSCLPQDGRFSFNNIDVRLATMPIYSGEKIVMRLLIARDNLANLKDLGLPEIIERELIIALSKFAGLVLVTGPTGSGKTTTLYALLRTFDAKKKNIITIEDPVEYQLPGINQIQINNSVGLTFTTVLKNILRQDPDIIFIGEIRDSETATIALRAALTGHLVFATLHTRDSSEAIVRLRDLGIPNYIIEKTIIAVLAQKLYRKICNQCRGQGCIACEQDGFLGRSGIYEFFVPEKKILYDFKQAKEDILKRELTTPEELFII